MRSASSYILSAAAALTAVVSAQSSTTTIQVFGAGPTQVPLNGVHASVVDANAAGPWSAQMSSCVRSNRP